ncbi:MAG TPA: glycosyltransferase family 4 protein [Acidimicrobiales bacterium]|nr:glycosyltransferase family 4 protein [Acidimicrobiales bacterium]
MDERGGQTIGATEPWYGAAGPPAVVVASILRPEGTTGVQTHVREFCEYVADRGGAPALVTPFSWGRPIQAPVLGARFLFQRWKPSAGVAWYRHWHEEFLCQALRRELSRLDDVVIYAHGPEAARAGLRARKGPQQRVVMAAHYNVSQTEGWVDKGLLRRQDNAYRAIRKMESEVLPKVDGIVFVSDWARQEILAWLPEIERVPHAIIHNFVKAKTSTAGPMLGDLVTVGALQPTKRHLFLLQTVAEAKKMGRPYTLDIYGGGPLQGQLRSAAHSLGVEQYVTFRGFRSDVRNFLPRYRGYVHACTTETGPIAIIEAMAAGLPIVAPNAGGIPELFDNDVEGRYISTEDATEAATSLIELLADEPARANYASAAADRFSRDFDVKVIGPQLEAFVVRGGGTRPPAPQQGQTKSR